MDYDDEMEAVAMIKNAIEELKITNPEYLPKTEEEKIQFAEIWFNFAKDSSMIVSLWVTKKIDTEEYEKMIDKSIALAILDDLVPAKIYIRNGQTIEAEVSISDKESSFIPAFDFKNNEIKILMPEDVDKIIYEIPKSDTEFIRRSIRRKAEYIVKKHSKIFNHK